MGHAPMFADPDFANLSQQIGLLSIGASPENIKKLGALYLYIVEFGICKENGDLKAFGAGIAGCIEEIENVENRGSEFRPLDPFNDLVMELELQRI